MKKLVLGFMVMMLLMTISACKRDVYGDIFINTDLLAERTTRFTFTATGYMVFDTIFNNWEDTVDIVLPKE